LPGVNFLHDAGTGEEEMIDAEHLHTSPPLRLARLPWRNKWLPRLKVKKLVVASANPGTSRKTCCFRLLHLPNQ
jgi:hypothetical protein